MYNNLDLAVRFVEKFRFSRDKSSETMNDSFLLQKHKDHSLTNELRISSNVTPSLYRCLNTVYSRLHISNSMVSAFVYASPEFQATCFPGENKECIIRFSSTLVDVLDERELEFVIGHELGHFLYGHSGLANRKQGLEYLFLNRAQEISADRVGLIACESMDVAMRALMKTISGLKEEYLRFDSGSFLSQLNELSEDSAQGGETLTHPSILIRSRSLLSFSRCGFLSSSNDEFCKSELNKIDDIINKDLDRYIDGPSKKYIKSILQDIAMWKATIVIIRDKVISKREQKEFSERFGEDTLEKLLRFLQESPISEIEGLVSERLNESIEQLKELLPISYQSEIDSISKWDI